MLRAVVLSARLDFDIDEPILEAIETHRHEIGRSAPARLLEEYFKILRSGSAEKSLRKLKANRSCCARSLRSSTGCAGALWESVARLDQYRAALSRQRPTRLTNAIIAGSLLVAARPGVAGSGSRRTPLERRVELGMLQMPRRDVEHLQQILALQPRLLDLQGPVRAQRALLHRHVFNEALTWLEIHGDRPEVVAHWREMQAEPRQQVEGELEPFPAPRRRRRRRRRGPSAIGR